MSELLPNASWIRPHEPEVAGPGHDRRTCSPRSSSSATTCARPRSASPPTASSRCSSTADGSAATSSCPGFTSYRKRLQVFTYPVARAAAPRPQPRRGAAQRRLVPRAPRLRAARRRIRRRDRPAAAARRGRRGGRAHRGRERRRLALPAEPHHARRPHGRPVGRLPAPRGLPPGPTGRRSPWPRAALYDDRDRASSTRRRPRAPRRDAGPGVRHPAPPRHRGHRRRPEHQRLDAPRRPRPARHRTSPSRTARCSTPTGSSRPRTCARSSSRPASACPPGQVDEVISAGRDGDVFEPRHTTHGFRYVQVDGVPDRCGRRRRRAASSCTPTCAPVGEFACSDDRINALHDIAALELPRQRLRHPDRLPAARARRAGPATGRSSSPRRRSSTTSAASPPKWLADLAADQWPDGRVPTVVPNPAGDGPSGVVFEDLSAGSAGWGDAAVLVPWELWRAYGDLEVLRRQLPVDAALGRLRGERGGRPRGIPTASPPGPSRRRTSSTSGTRASTSASGSSPACRHGPIRRSTTAIVADRVPAPLGAPAPRHPPSCSATPTRRPSARRIADGALDAWRREFVTPPGRLDARDRRRTTRAASRSGCSRRRRRDAAAARLAELIADSRRPPRHRLPQHRPPASRPRRPRPPRRRVRRSSPDTRALVARHARARRDHRVGVVGRHRRRRHRRAAR